ncbi:sensor domain-containing protein [Sinimarinibacterium thermocellulolyticum]|uniref:Diguanylate cyclase n=1 Tax=Sinimarinibacterium thermocellulolyticum TaxID=3170016 RepID=A0ABV2A668_9GAMM
MDGQRWRVALLGVSGIGLLTLGLACLVRAHGLQTRLDHAQVGGEVQRALLPALQRGDGERRLRPLVDALMQRPDLALYALAVYDAEGVLLTRAGMVEHLRLPLLPASIQDRARSAWYALIGSVGSRRLFAEDRRLLGSVAYSLDAGDVEGVRIEALAALRLAGWFALALAVPIGLMFGLAVRRRLRTPPPWAGRADPLRQTPNVSSWGADPRALGDRAGEVMDALGYGLVLIDRDGRVRHLNTTAERLTGWSGADAAGRMHYSVVHLCDAADGDARLSLIEHALAHGRPRAAASAELRQRHGGHTPVEAVAHPMRDRRGALDTVTLLFRDQTAHRREIEALRREVRLSQAVVDHLDEGLLTTDLAGVVRSANARAERMFGYSRDELVGFTVAKLMPVPFLNLPAIRITDYVPGRSQSRPPKVVGWRKDATTFPVDLWVQPMRVDGADGLVVIVRDLSERQRGENLATRLGRLLDAASEEIYIFDAQTLRFLEVNRGARRNLGYDAEALVRMTPLDISEDLSEDGLRNFLARLHGGERDDLVYRCRHRRADGSTYPVEVRLHYSRAEEPPVFLAIASDISERLAAERKLDQLAYFDALTGLPNRVMLHDRLSQALLAAQRGARMLGVFFLDLDRFKAINDEYGHEVGDQVLRAVADRLRAVVRPSDTVARLSGDEFVLLTPGLRSAEDAALLAHKVLERFAQPLDLPGLSITCRPSIGITLYPLDESDADGLLRHADQAMYQAKQAGRGCFRLYTLHIDPKRLRQLELERELHAAVALNQFHLEFTPALAADGRARALLARLRWLHPRHGWVEQGEIFQAAGRAGLVADIELWMICAACERLRAAAAAALPLLPQVLPLSGWQLRDREFLGHLTGLIDRYAVPVSALVLALTPDGQVEAATHHPHLDPLIARGLRFGLRDFNRVPDTLPLPLSHALMHASLSADAAAVARLRAALDAAALLVAVGVDDADTRARCEKLGVDCMAGVAVAPTLPAAALNDWLRNARVDA